MPGLSFVVVSEDPKKGLVLESSSDVEIRGYVKTLDELVSTVNTHHPHALLVSLDSNPEATFDALEKLLSPKPLIIFHGPDDSGLILKAMRSGGFEYIPPSDDAKSNLLAAIRRASLETVHTSALPEAPLIAMVGSKGGVGTSFAACQLAASLAQRNATVALVDGHRRHGDVALYLDLTPKYDFASLAIGDEPIDTTYLHSALAAHSSGIAVLAAPMHPEEADAVTSTHVSKVMKLLRGEYDWVIWDLPQDFEDRSLGVLDQANPVVLVTTPDVPALSHTKMQLELLARLGRSEDDIRIVLNRTHSRAPVSLKDAQEFLQRPIDASIPNDYARSSACVNEGRTLADLAPRSAIEHSMSQLARLAHTWTGRIPPVPARRGLFSRFKPQKGK